VEEQSQDCVSIGHLSLIVKGWLMITMHCKTFRRKGKYFADQFFVCMAVLLVFKNQYILMATT
jgi:hypothetical protein